MFFVRCLLFEVLVCGGVFRGRFVLIVFKGLDLWFWGFVVWRVVGGIIAVVVVSKSGYKF